MRPWAGGLGTAEVPRAAFQDAKLPWRVGQSVRHAKFGDGVIVRLEGGGADTRVHVNFRDGGLKQLMLAFANLAAA